MSFRKYSNFWELAGLFSEVVVPLIGERHLDFGCGDGMGTSLQARLVQNSHIIGADMNRSIIDIARRKYGEFPNVDFLHLQELLGCFDSAGANFVFHEDPEILHQISSFIAVGSKVYVLDYNMKGISERDFRKNFCLDNELKVLGTEGIEECYVKHTSLGPEDCQDAACLAGFETCSLHETGHYYAWVGELS